MKYFILWIIFSNGDYQPFGTFASLAECQRTETTLSQRLTADKHGQVSTACLPEGTYPKAPEVRR